MKYFLCTVFVLTMWLSFAFSQSGRGSNADCEKLGSKKVLLNTLIENGATFQADFKAFMYCRFDSIDYQIMRGPKKDLAPALSMGFSLMVNTAGIKESILFNDFVDPINKFKESADYAQTREIVLGMNVLGSKKASLSTWNEDSLLLVKMNFPDSGIAELKIIVEENRDSDLDYASVFVIYGMRMKEKEIAEKEAVALNIISDYNEGVAKSKETAMPALIFFSDRACINSQKMEKNVLEHLEIKKLIFFNFVFVKLMVDEKKLLPEKEQGYSNELKKTRKTIGDKNLEIEMAKYKSNMQPLFVIVSPFNNEVTSYSYSLDVEDFMRFLNQGLGK